MQWSSTSSLPEPGSCGVYLAPISAAKGMQGQVGGPYILEAPPNLCLIAC